MEDNENKALIQKIIEASNYIHVNSRRGTASYVQVSNETLRLYAEARGITEEEAFEIFKRYGFGEIDHL